MNVARGVMLGRTAKDVSPTRPRVTLWTAEASTGSFKYGAADEVRIRDCGNEACHLTVYQHSVGERVHCPNIRCPICMAETSREREESLENLRDLLIVNERSESKASHNNDAESKLDAVEELDVKD